MLMFREGIVVSYAKVLKHIQNMFANEEAFYFKFGGACSNHCDTDG
jgi:hypothetical protein